MAGLGMEVNGLRLIYHVFLQMKAKSLNKNVFGHLARFAPFAPLWHFK
ncbi:MAG: hypothetical protein IKP00_02915 [Victivallales bacterium]|nr:hypothetical protein [Victivallales bacterium]